jgi:hypothetical protein
MKRMGVDNHPIFSYFCIITIQKNVNVYPSCIVLPSNGFGSISQHSVLWVFFWFLQLYHFRFPFILAWASPKKKDQVVKMCIWCMKIRIVYILHYTARMLRINKELTTQQMYDLYDTYTYTQFIYHQLMNHKPNNFNKCFKDERSMFWFHLVLCLYQVDFNR